MKAAISGEALGSICSLEEIISVLKQHGVHAIEIWPENIPVKKGEALLHKRFYANRDITYAKKLLEEAQMEVACVCFGAGFDLKLAQDEVLFAEELERSVRVARELGARVVNHYCCHVSMGSIYDKEKLKRYYKKAIKTAEKYQIYLALENEAHDITKSPLQMKQIVKDMGSPFFKTNYDATNYYQAGYEGFPYAYELLKEDIVHVHIKNGCIYCPGHGHREECAGEAMTGPNEGERIFYPVASDGAVNIDGLLRRLKKDRYEGFCSLEPHTIPQLCMEYYREETGYLYHTGFFE